MKTTIAFLMFAWVCAVVGPDGASRARPVSNIPPVKGTDWLRRADELTNIRMPGSPAFHLKVAFHAYRGVDFAEPGKSSIVTGNGTYEEWWISPKRWRREVGFGGYHAIEVFDGIRKFQATSDYEPKRVVMLLHALLYPVPRYLIEPELEGTPEASRSAIANKKLAWKVKHLSAGDIAYVELSYRVDDGKCIDMMAYDLLPNGMPVRLTDRMGLIIGWEKQTAFGGRAVPRHLSIKAMGRDVVTADIEIESAPPEERVLLQLNGDAAAACMTLRPFDEWDFSGLSNIHSDVPQLPPGAVYPAGVEIVTTGVVDRQGIPHEAETTGVQQDSRWLRNEEKNAISMHARAMVESWYRNRFYPVLLDGSPCEILARTSLLSANPSFAGGIR